jgi:hypothetical protein
MTNQLMNYHMEWDAAEPHYGRETMCLRSQSNYYRWITLQ